MILTDTFKRQQTESDIEGSSLTDEGRRTSTYIVYSTSTRAETVGALSNTSTSLDSASTFVSPPRTPAAAIAGGVLGGIVFAFISSVFLILFLRFRRRRQASRELPLQDNKQMFYQPDDLTFPGQASMFRTKSAEMNVGEIKRSVETNAHVRTLSEGSLITEPPVALMPCSVSSVSMMTPVRPIRGSVSLSSLCPSRSEQSMYPLLGSPTSSDELIHAHDPFVAYTSVSIVPARSIPRSNSRTTLGL